MKQDLVRLKDICAGYEGIPVIHHVNLTIEQHDFLGIIGPNGGGKTTLLKVILRLLKPYSGEVNYLFQEDTQRGTIGYLPQFHLIDKRFPITVKDVVLSGATHSMRRKMGVRGVRQAAESLMEQLGILSLKKKAIGELSGGQTQKVFLCRAIVSSPQLLVLDEPDTFVDKESKSGIYEILSRLNQEMAIVIVSHDPEQISSCIKNIACVTDGQLHYHSAEETVEKVEELVGCPVERLGHGEIPHRVLRNHGTGK